MNERLHPLTLGEILDRTAHLYRSRFLVFLGIAICPAASMFLLAGGAVASIASLGASTKSGNSTGAFISMGVFIAVLVLFVPLALAANALGQAAMTDASARLFLGSGITIRSSYKAAWQTKWRFLGLYVLMGLIILGIPGAVLMLAIVPLSIGGALGASGQSSALFGLLMLLLIVAVGAAAVWLLLRYCLAFAACVVEQTTATNALGRAARLSHGTRARIFVLYLLGVVLNQVLAVGITIPAVILMALVPALSRPAHQQIAGMIAVFCVYGAMFAVRALVSPIYGIALTLFYFDQRIRKEGFDIEWMMQQAGMVSPPLAPSITEPATVVAPGSQPSSSSPALLAERNDELPAPVPLLEPTLINTPEEGPA